MWMRTGAAQAGIAAIVTALILIGLGTPAAAFGYKDGFYDPQESSVTTMAM
jgi:hypothetical protein